MSLNYNETDLFERGKYLTEVIDKLENKASYKDIENIPKGNNIVCWGPSSGKTTAIRQFIVNHYNETGIFATKLVEDVDQLYYDVIAQLTYLGKNPNHMVHMIKKFHSGSKNTSPMELQSCSWVLCTHERLFIEPPSLLFLMDITTLGGQLINPTDIYRKYLFIDEYPSSMFKSFNISDLASLRLFDHEAGTYNSTDSELSKSIMRTAYISKLYDEPTTDPLLISMMNNLPTPTDQSYILDIDRGKNAPASEFSRRRIAFFADHLLNKLDEYNSTVPIEARSTNDKLYYSVNDLLVQNTYVFDGTGDILFKNSDNWELNMDTRFSRRLNLRNPVRLVESKVNRTDTTELIATEYADIITKISDKHKNESLLVYTWKNSKNRSTTNDEDLINKIKSKLSPEINVEFVYYMSGKERVTSEFQEATVAIVLGKFYVPNYSIAMLNAVNKTNLTTVDNTLSLMIQFIYRTAARINKGIDLYITTDYSIELIEKLLNKFRLLGHTTIDTNILKSDCTVIKNQDLLNKLLDSDKVINSTPEFVEYNSVDLRDELGLSSSSSNDSVQYKLNAENINYEYLIGRPSKYRIFTQKGNSSRQNCED